MGKGSNIKGLGSSWMSKHTRNLLGEMPIDNRASGKGPGKHGYEPQHGKGPAQTFWDKAQDALSDLTSYRFGGTDTGSLLDQRNRGNLKRLIPQSEYTINQQKARDSVMNAREQERMQKYPYYAKSVERQRAKQNQKKS